MLPPHTLIKWEKRFYDLLNKTTSENYSKGYQIYHQGYWRRLEKFLLQYFPSVVKITSEEVWQQEIVYPYITENPPLDWDVESWLKKFPEWVLKQKSDLFSVPFLSIVELEQLHLRTFLSEGRLQHPSIDQLHHVVLKIQPHVHFLFSDYPIYSYWKALSNEEELPLLEKEKKRWIVLSLDQTGEVVIKEISLEEKIFLDTCSGRSLEDAIKFIAEENPEFLLHLKAHVQEWTMRWINLGWLGVSSS